MNDGDTYKKYINGKIEFLISKLNTLSKIVITKEFSDYMSTNFLVEKNGILCRKTNLNVDDTVCLKKEFNKYIMCANGCPKFRTIYDIWLHYDRFILKNETQNANKFLISDINSEEFGRFYTLCFCYAQLLQVVYKLSGITPQPDQISNDLFDIQNFKLFCNDVISHAGYPQNAVVGFCPETNEYQVSFELDKRDEINRSISEIIESSNELFNYYKELQCSVNQTVS